jgi:hypothetical protein
VLLTIIIVSLTITALISSLATAAKAGSTQHNGVRIDVVLRSYAEATKLGVQSCVVGGTYTVTYVAPTGFTTSVAPTGGACPKVTGTLNEVAPILLLTVNGPSNSHASMQLRVRTP